MKVILDSYEGQVVPLAYHMYWPGAADSFNLFNPTDAQTRRVYYGVNYVPSFRYDGKYIADPSDFATYEEWYDFTRATFDSLLAIPSPLRINLDQYWSQDMDSVYASFDVICEDSVDFNMTMHFVVAEGGHFYAFKSTSYSKRWYHAMRDMVPNASGTALTMVPGDSLHYDWVYPIYDVFAQDDPLLVDDKWDMETIIFVQRSGTGRMQQAYSARVQDISSVRPGATPEALALSKAWPNPFRGATSIAYAVPKAGNVRLSVYTAEGRLVTRLVDGPSEPGTYSAVWDGRDRFGSEVGSGMYFYRLETDGRERTGRMVFLK